MRAKKRGQAIAPFLGQRVIELLRGAPAIDDAEHLRMPAQVTAQLVRPDTPEIGQRRPAQRGVQRFGMRANFPYGKRRGELLQKRRNRWLRRCTKDGGRMVKLYQLRDRGKTRQQIINRDGLRLVEDHNTACDVMQLPAAAGAIGIERLKKLHCRCDDDRRVPVFARQKFPVLRAGHLLGLCQLIFRAGIVRQHVFCSEKV